MKVPPRNGSAPSAAMTSPMSTRIETLRCRLTRSADQRCQLFKRCSQSASGRSSWLRNRSAQSAGVEVIATTSEATTANMNASASGPTKRRSEEHTSELQSRLHLVCRLLLEKKKRTEVTSSQDDPHEST